MFMDDQGDNELRKLLCWFFKWCLLCCMNFLKWCIHSPNAFRSSNLLSFHLARFFLFKRSTFRQGTVSSWPLVSPAELVKIQQWIQYQIERERNEVPEETKKFKRKILKAFFFCIFVTALRYGRCYCFVCIEIYYI